MVEERHKVIVVGLDGATFDLIKPWVEQGHLPTFAQLMKDGAWGEMEAEIPPITLPNWPSFATGKNAGKHGMIFWLTRKSDTGDFGVVNSEAIRHRALWDKLGKADRRVAVIYVLGTFPQKQVNGVMITGMLTPPSANVYTYPMSLEPELEKTVGRYLVFPDEVYAEGKEERFLKSLRYTTERRFEAAKYLLAKEAWDLFLVVFNCTDIVQHTFWRYYDPNHPQYQESKAKRFGDAILEVYRHMDGVLNYLVRQVDDNTTLVVMSDHGAGPVYQRSHINNWLMDEGLLRLKNNPMAYAKNTLFRSGLTVQNTYRMVEWLRLVNMRRHADPRRQGRGLLRSLFLSYQDIDWKKTKAFAFGGTGQIFINVKGKGPEGAVEPGEEYERLCDEIIGGLKQLTLPNSDRPYIARVHKKEELYSGEEMDAMPDLVFEPTDENYGDCGDFEFFSNKLFDYPVGVSGRHRRNGILFFHGGRIKPGGFSKGRIFDITPTILHLMGQPVPEDMDGRVLEEVLDEDFVKDNPVQRSEASRSSDSAGTTMSKEDEEAILERLRGLGYIG
jgi:predicted AlkP superfamily phosphohydrolase/phosphomutase